MQHNTETLPLKLRMSGISKAFPGVQALDDVSFAASAGEVVGVVGVNGAGKSTLMNILGGVLQPNQGQIAIDGQTVTLRSPADADRHGIAFIHQELLTFASQSVAENIFMSRLPSSPIAPWLVSRKRVRTQARAYLELLGSDVSVTARMEQLSIGEMQIVEIARALAAGADIVIFDEPTSSLSVKEKDILFGVVRRLKSERKTVIYISHFLDEILDLCDSFVVLRNGKLAGQGEVRDADKNAIIRMVVGKDVVAIQPSKRRSGTMVPALSVDGLRSGNLLNGVSLQLNQGEILGLWGLMGSGRTEVLRAITGLDVMNAGQLRVAEGGQLVRVTPRQLLQTCGYVTENRRVDGLFLAEPVWKNITAATLNRYTSGVWRFLNRYREAETAREFIASLAIRTPGPNARVSDLSGGNQQKVIFAKWLHKRPPILLLDEPTRGVDVAAKQELAGLIVALAREGAAVLIVSSEVEEMVTLCDRVLVLRGGTIVSELGGEEINEATLMAQALGRASEHERSYG